MKMFKAADVTRNSGDVFAAAAAEPVAITRHSKPRFVVMSVEKYQAMVARSDPRQAFGLGELPDKLSDQLMESLEEDLT